MRRAHFKIKWKGSREKWSVLCHILNSIDKDWPVKNPYVLPIMCNHCQGVVWRLPRFTLEQVRGLVKQLNDSLELKGHLKLKLQNWKYVMQVDDVVADCRDGVRSGI